MPRFAIIVLALGLAWVNSRAQAQAPSASVVPQSTVEQQQAGTRMLAEVLATMQRRASVSARLRYQARLYDDQVIGSGKYWQLGVGTQRRTRWEMQSQVADTTASYVQVFNGEHLWTDRTLPSGRHVTRLDMKRLQALRRPGVVTSQSSQPPWTPLLVSTEGQGGLAEMLADLLRNYSFSPPRKTQLNGLAAFALVGQWQAERLEKLWPGLSDPSVENPWPRHLPHHVLVLVGQNNLFPYLIEQRRQGDAALVQSASGDRPADDPLMRYEIYEVQFAAALEDSLFQYNPGDQPWSDETAMVFEQLK